jgi:hypothetical protein
MAAPAAAVAGGDINGDGHVDVSDGARLARHLFAGGPPPVCDAAANLVPNDTVEVGDVLANWYSVGPRTAPYRPAVDAESCPETERTVEPPCGDGLAMSVTAPAQVSGPAGAATTFDVTVTLTSPLLEVEAWSFTADASGCTFVSGTTANTPAADRADGTGGLRDRGVAWQSIGDSQALGMTVLDWRNQGVLPLGGPTAVHTLSVSATPGSDCAPCTISLVPGDASVGVETVVSVEGWRYAPVLGSVSIEVCAE